MTIERSVTAVSTFLTTKEVAGLLRIKERKVYELVRDGAIPVSRATGKLLFPRDMVEAWLRRSVTCRDGTERLVEAPLVIAGSHDPLLEWALRESVSGIATFFDGSIDGLERLHSGEAIGAGIHVYEPGTGAWNEETITHYLPSVPLVLIEWAKRRQGLVLPAGNPADVRGPHDVVGLAFVPRQASAGSRLLFEHLLTEAGVDGGGLSVIDPPARSESDVALAVAHGKAEVGFAIEAVARQLCLAFVPLVEERYDLALLRRDYFQAPMQRLLAFCRTEAFSRRAKELGGYDVSAHATVHYNGP